MAVPLALTGRVVLGIDSSPEMLELLRKRPQGDLVKVSLGDFSTLEDLPWEQLGLVYVVYSTLFLVDTEEGQRRCFEGVAARLAHDGLFVVEAFVPDETRYNQGQSVMVEDINADEVRIELAKHDPGSQTIRLARVTLSSLGGACIFPYTVRYAYPEELDRFAEDAGMRLIDRMANFAGDPFVPGSSGHVSTYALA